MIPSGSSQANVHNEGYQMIWQFACGVQLGKEAYAAQILRISIPHHCLPPTVQKSQEIKEMLGCTLFELLQNAPPPPEFVFYLFTL